MARAKTRPAAAPLPAGRIPDRRTRSTPPAPPAPIVRKAGRKLTQSAAPEVTTKKPARPARPAVVAAPPAPVTAPVTAPASARAASAVRRQSGSKQAGIIAGLRRPEGATIAELMRLTGWMSHSVRGALSGALKRKLGLAIASSTEAERGRVYRIVDPVQAQTQVPTAEPIAAPAPASTGQRRRKRQPDSAGAAATA